jgi:genome maintenance exonuclease 1
MWNPKFNYIGLERKTVDGVRRYLTPDGRKLPSVTTILDATKPAEKVEALRAWRERVGEETAKKITTEAANRGTRMHTYLEDYIKTGVLKDRGSNPYSWASHSMAECVIKNGLKSVGEFWGVEVPLYFPEIYAGTTDCAGVHNGLESILDFKQTNKPKKREWIEDYFLQLAAYAEAHNELWGTRINRGVIIMCVKPAVEEATQKQISPPEYQEFILEGAEFEKYRSMWWQRVEQYYVS